MKTDELEDKEEIEEYKPPAKKLGGKNKAQTSKVSKESHMSRRRPQPDSSEDQLMPKNIPTSSGTEVIITQGIENELTKVVITVPYSLLVSGRFQCVVQTRVLNMEVVFSVEKQNDNLTVLGKLPFISKKMQVEEQQKMREPMSSNSDPDTQQLVSVLDFWGKYVYMAGHQSQNRNIKRIRKQLNSIEYGQMIKFKLKEPCSDLFIYLHLKIEEYLNYDYMGLVNQGNTCYMNSYLQTLYHIPAFRNLVYEAEIQDETKFPATLQELFFDLDTSQKSASPEALVKSFGWGKHQASIQQDAQQFSCLFFEALEHKLNSSAPKAGYKNRTIETLFKGSLNHYIRCTHVGTVIDYTDFRNENYEDFIDLQLTIAPTLTQSLDLYTSEVHLEGDNAYHTDEYGKQEAFKGVKLGHLPPVLMIQLKRFEYSFQQNKNIKILASLDYEEELDFGKWTTSGQKNVYELYAVLVHQGGRAQSGHYFNYVKDCENWYKFNDESVQLVTRQRAFNFNFGGFHQTIEFDSKEMKVTKKFLESKTTAYMLVYINQSLKKELMKDNEKYPEWIKKKNINKIQMEEDKKNKKNFFHNVRFIDWETNLQRSICSDEGFLNEIILKDAKIVIPQIPKEANLEQWLSEQKMIDPKLEPVEEKKKKSKRAKASDQQKYEPKQAGIYLFYVTDRQILIGSKPSNKVIDILKASPDPVLFKAPFQAKKDEYLGVIKRYRVDKNDGKVETSFSYETLLPIKKEITYTELMNTFVDKFLKPDPVEGGLDKFMSHSFYIDDLKQGPINIQRETGPIPFPSPKFNQLLVCVVQQISFEMSREEKELYSFPKYYDIRKDIISLNITEQKGATILSKKDISGNQSLASLRKIIFENLPQDKRAQFFSPQNIVLKAKIKKGSKVYNEVSQPDWKTVKDITKVDDRIEFTFSALTVESRLSKYMIQIHYRNKNREFSDPIDLVVQKEESGQTLVKIIKTHPTILEMLKNDGFTEDQAEVILMTKMKTFINDVVNNEGKVPCKGDLDTVLKKYKNAVIVVEGRTFWNLQKQPTIQINEDEFDPVVNILIHHMSNSGQKIGNPLYLKVDRRMQLSELKEKILDLIKDQVFHWEGKFHICNPDKTIIQMYGKESKKVIELTDLETLEAMKRLKIDQKNHFDTKSKKSKDLKNTGRPESPIEEVKETILEIVDEQEEPHMNGQEIIDLDRENEKPIQQKKSIEQDQVDEKDKISIEKDNVVEISDDAIEKDEELKQSDEEKGNQAIVDPEITKIEGPETIFGVFPRLKVLKVRILHSYLTRPNYVMKIHVYD